MRLRLAALLVAAMSSGMLLTDARATWAIVTASQSARAMALTFDDLPFVPGEQPNTLAAAARATSTILRVLTAHRASAVGFVNEGKLQVGGEVDGRIGLLQQWVDAGAILGNHTYSHVDLNTVTVNRAAHPSRNASVGSTRSARSVGTMHASMQTAVMKAR